MSYSVDHSKVLALRNFPCLAISAWSIRSEPLCRFSTLFDSRQCIPAGKTTLLRHLLQNTAGLKVGCIINDVAGVNVDAKLVRNDRSRGGEAKTDSTSDLTDTLELANGCACVPLLPGRVQAAAICTPE